MMEKDKQLIQGSFMVGLDIGTTKISVMVGRKNKYGKFFSSILSKFIGLNIRTNKGDIVIFLANLLHSEIPTKKSGRVSAFLSYGPNNKHSKNYVNYYMMHRKGYNIPEEYNKKFFDMLRDKNIFFPLPKKKKI